MVNERTGYIRMKRSYKQLLKSMLVASLVTGSVFTAYAHTNHEVTSYCCESQEDGSQMMMAGSMHHQGMTHSQQNMHQGMMPIMHEIMQPGMPHHGMRHGVDDVAKFQTIQQAARPLAIPPLLEGTLNEQGRTVFNIVAQAGESQLKDGDATKTYGYNGNVLGPVLSMKQGDKVSIHLKNTLPEETTFHWHGLVVPSDVDGGPHHPIAANGGTGQIDFTVNQEASTAWFHPHAMGTTASQVYKGLAGLIRIEDEEQTKLGLPNTYGVDDIPVVLQDRNFTANNQWDYKSSYEADGVYGDTLLVNGTINPYFKVNAKIMRLRLLNGSNARNYTLKLSDGASFKQIASDGGLLETPVTMSTLTLAPGERAEVVMDFQNMKANCLL